MFIQNDAIHYSDNRTIKAITGRLSTALMRLKNTVQKVLIGDLEFPTQSIQELSGTFDGDTRVKDGKVLISKGGIWHTINTVSVKIEQNLGQNQQAFFTIQYGNQSKVALNASESVLVFVHQDNASVVITASNFSSGAVAFAQATPVAGQAYAVSSQSSTRQEGSLQNICVEQGYDLRNAPVVKMGKNQTLDFAKFSYSPAVYEYNSPIFTYTSHTYYETLDYARDRFGLIGMFDIYNHPRQERDVVQAFQNQRIQLELSRDEYPQPYDISTLREDLSVSDQNLANLHNRTTFTVPNTPDGSDKTYSFSINGADTQFYGGAVPKLYLDVYDGNLESGDTDIIVKLEQGKTYQLFVDFYTNDVLREALDDVSDGHGLQWRYRQFVDTQIVYKLQIYGPLTPQCLRTEVVDTRKTINEISVNIAELN